MEPGREEEGGREEGREGGREGKREGGREGGRERGRENICKTHPTLPWPSFVCVCAYNEMKKRGREGDVRWGKRGREGEARWGKSDARRDKKENINAGLRVQLVIRNYQQ